LSRDENGPRAAGGTAYDGRGGVTVTDVTAKWPGDQTENTLDNVNVTVTAGQLVAIIGPVGAGKVRTSPDVRVPATRWPALGPGRKPFRDGAR